MGFPRVLVGTPTIDTKKYVVEAFLEGLKAIDYPHFDILLVDNSETDDFAKLLTEKGVPVERSPHMENVYEQLITARNLLRKRAIEGGYDYLFSVEADVVPESSALKKMIAHKAPYVTTVMYNVEKPDQEPFIVIRKEQKDAPGRFRDVTQKEIDAGDVIEIHRAHLGCTLISVELLKKIPFRQDGYYYDDYLFCDDARKAGYTLLCDTTVHAEHYPDGSAHKRSRAFRNKRDREDWAKYGKLRYNK